MAPLQPQNKNQQQQQQQRHEQGQREDNYSAQRAAVEAIEIGRATLEATQRQSEQLVKAQDDAIETQLKLNKAERVIKGMTWSGWVSNLVHSAVTEPISAKFSSSAGTSSNNDNDKNNNLQEKKSSRDPPLIYDEDNFAFLKAINTSCDGFVNEFSGTTSCASTMIPSSVIPAIQNYHANLNVLLSCETMEQRETCIEICRAMYPTALQNLYDAKNHAVSTAEIRALSQLQDDLRILRERYVKVEHQLKIEKQQQQQQIQQQQQQRQQQQHHEKQQQQQAKLEEQQQLACRNKVSTTTAAASALFPSNSTAGKSVGASTLATGASVSSRKIIVNGDVAFQKQMEQDQHLEFLGQHLSELGQLSSNLHIGLSQQNELLDDLNDHADTIMEQSRRVTRRADRMAQDKSSFLSRVVFKSGQPSCVCRRLAIRHVTSQKYLSVLQSDLYLIPMPKYGKESCWFDVYARGGGDKDGGKGSAAAAAGGSAPKTSLFGLKNCFSNKWLGQSFLLGGLACTATSFGHREEWEADRDEWWRREIHTTTTTTTTKTKNGNGVVVMTSRLLCASAGWGAGGYLFVRPKDLALSIGGGTIDDKKQADLFEFIVIDDGE